MIRSNVVLPQPDGPSRKNSSWSWTSSEISLSTAVSPNFLARLWIETRMNLVGCERVAVFLARDSRPMTLCEPPILLLRPGLPLNFLLIPNYGIFPGSGRQLKRFGFGNRHASQIHAVRFGQSPADHRTPRVLQLGQGIDQQRARERCDDLAPFAR